MAADDHTSETTGQTRLSKIAGITPEISTFSFSGHLASQQHEFDIGTEVFIQLTDLDGEIIASERVEIEGVGAKVKRDKDGFISRRERAHKVKLG